MYRILFGRRNNMSNYYLLLIFVVIMMYVFFTTLPKCKLSQNVNLEITWTDDR